MDASPIAGRYEVIRPLGQGSFAETLLARDLTGLTATARVIDMTLEPVGFEVSMTRVRYEFEADGLLHRDSDQVLPSIAGRWDTGTSIQVLYLPGEEYDSVIISTS